MERISYYINDPLQRIIFNDGRSKVEVGIYEFEQEMLRRKRHKGNTTNEQAYKIAMAINQYVDFDFIPK
jgi:hypothetical protein